MKPICNMDIPVSLWLKRFNRDQLRSMASEYGIKRGRNMIDTAANLSCGVGSNGKMIQFRMVLFNAGRKC